MCATPCGKCNVHWIKANNFLLLSIWLIIHSIYFYFRFWGRDLFDFLRRFVCSLSNVSVEKNSTKFSPLCVCCVRTHLTWLWPIQISIHLHQRQSVQLSQSAPHFILIILIATAVRIYLVHHYFVHLINCANRIFRLEKKNKKKNVVRRSCGSTRGIWHLGQGNTLVWFYNGICNNAGGSRTWDIRVHIHRTSRFMLTVWRWKHQTNRRRIPIRSGSLTEVTRLEI